MNRDRMRTVVAIMVIAAMVLLAAGALGSLLGGPADATGAHVDPTAATTRAPRALGA